MLSLIILVLSLTTNKAEAATLPQVKTEVQVLEMARPATSTIPVVPFYSQFKDIVSPAWKKVGCGVTSLAMILEYYKPDSASVSTLLTQGIQSGAYIKNVGWSYAGLISLGKKYGLRGESYDLGKKSKVDAYTQFKASLTDGPVIASVHYHFDPKSKIPHLVVINGIKDGLVYYNDPAGKTGAGHISEAVFLSAWKKRFIVMRPVTDARQSAVATQKDEAKS